MDVLKPSLMQLESLRDYCQSMDESETDDGSRVWALDVDAVEYAISILREATAPENKPLTLNKLSLLLLKAEDHDIPYCSDKCLDNKSYCTPQKRVECVKEWLTQAY
ncbi:hypothetical protein [Clostridium sp. KNHs216]|uniref:hypothetical protein n=1 Tax=Clostridium sp. KNHs216 TaxID=1550235 RepID=UPI00114F9410|nr:hypothetical protein [Clostridium sp. KNHs216]TQI68544.1 hypothetical protein LY85_3283 [Clostridium sp. KNHs216]